MEQPAETLAAPVRLRREGKLPLAEALDRRILERHPDHPGALHLPGVVAHQQKGKRDERDDIPSPPPSSPDSRYPDARHLFRWAWQKREHRAETMGTSSR
jgi:hypothetical protein